MEKRNPGGIAPAAIYATSLDEERQAKLRELIRFQLPTGPDASVLFMGKSMGCEGHYMIHDKDRR